MTRGIVRNARSPKAFGLSHVLLWVLYTAQPQPWLQQVYDLSDVCYLVSYWWCTGLPYSHVGGLAVHRGSMWSTSRAGPTWLWDNLSLLTT